MASPGITLRELQEKSVTDLKAVGPKLAPRLEAMGIATILDLLTHYPRRYHDRRNTQEIAALAVGEEATVYGVVKKASGRYTRQRRPIVEAESLDDLGKMVVSQIQAVEGITRTFTCPVVNL